MITKTDLSFTWLRSRSIWGTTCLAQITRSRTSLCSEEALHQQSRLSEYCQEELTKAILWDVYGEIINELREINKSLSQIIINEETKIQIFPLMQRVRNLLVKITP